MSTTTDPTDSRLGHGVDTEPIDQHDVYLVLSEGERAQGFVRPLRKTYVHVGVGGHEMDPNEPSRHGRVGSGCGAATRMNQSIAETYARDPGFYGSTYCMRCSKHLPVAAFVWEDDTVVGS